MTIDPSAKYPNKSFPAFRTLTIGDTFYLLMDNGSPNMKIEDALPSGEQDIVNTVELSSGELFYCSPETPVIPGNLMVVHREV